MGNEDKKKNKKKILFRIWLLYALNATATITAEKHAVVQRSE